MAQRRGVYTKEGSSAYVTSDPLRDVAQPYWKWRHCGVHSGACQSSRIKGWMWKDLYLGMDQKPRVEKITKFSNVKSNGE